jgi:hypothetical protein
MLLDYLIVTQSELRHYDVIHGMVDYVERGGIWDKKCLEDYATTHGKKPSPLIQISLFPDGARYVHDGHHRCVTTWLGGRHELYESEYEIRNWTYEEYLEINPEDQWVTPFDPRTQVRLPDTCEYKREARRIYLAEGLAAATKFIIANKRLYVAERDFWTIPELAESIPVEIVGRTQRSGEVA